VPVALDTARVTDATAAGPVAPADATEGKLPEPLVELRLRRTTSAGCHADVSALPDGHVVVRHPEPCCGRRCIQLCHGCSRFRAVHGPQRARLPSRLQKQHSLSAGYPSTAIPRAGLPTQRWPHRRTATSRSATLRKTPCMTVFSGRLATVELLQASTGSALRRPGVPGERIS
jgi:hypothetical protein